MGASEIATGALAVAAVGVAGIVGVRLWQSSQLAVETGRAIRGIRESGAEGGPGAVQTFIESLRAQGAYAGGAPGAAAATVANEGAGQQAGAIGNSARAAMQAAGRFAALGRNLTVVRPNDSGGNWSLGEGCWLPSEGEAQGWRTEPVAQVRGLDLGYALTYLPDVYPATVDGGRVICYPARFGYHKRSFLEAGNGNRRESRFATDAGIEAAADYEIAITSTAQQGGLVAVWRISLARFLTPREIAGLTFALDAPIGTRTIGDQRIPWMRSSFLRRMRNALDEHGALQPWPNYQAAPSGARIG